MPRTVGASEPPKWRVASRTDGRAQLKQKLRDAEDGIIDSSISVADWLDHWLTNVIQPLRRATTFEDYTWVCKKYVKPQLGRVKLSQLTTPMVRAWTNRLGEKYAAGTVANAYRRLRTACELATTDGLIRKNPCTGVEVSLAGEREGVALTIVQALELLCVAKDNPLYPLIFVALATGMRRGELIGLRWQNVLLDGPTPLIRVVEQIQIIKKKPVFVPPKSKAGRREIPIDQRVVDVLRAQLIGIEKRRKRTNWQEHELVFPGARGTPYSGRNLGRSFQRLVGLAKLPDMVFHDLRHTAGSLMLAEGASLVDVSKILGHSSPMITARIYSHSFADNKRSAVASVSKKLKS